jgi:hypothetical protein
MKLVSPSSSSATTSREPDWNSDSVRELFMEIASLPSVETIALQNFGMHSDSVPIHLLSILLATQAPLESFHLNCVCLLGTCHDIDELASTLKERKMLQSFRWSYCGFSTIVPSSCTIDSIIIALSSLPILKSLELWSYAEGSLGTLQRDTLSQLLTKKSSTLQALHVEGFTLEEEMVESMAIALRNNSSLRKLDLHIVKQTPIMGSLPLVDSLRHNNTLQVLELFLSTLDDDGNDDTTPSHNGDNVFLSHLADALLANKSLQDLRIHSNTQVTSLEEEAFAKLLETNTALQFLHLSGFEGDCRPKIEYFLSWNRRGRLPLQRNLCQKAAQQKHRQQQLTKALVEGKQGKKSKQRQRLNHP